MGTGNYSDTTLADEINLRFNLRGYKEHRRMEIICGRRHSQFIA